MTDQTDRMRKSAAQAAAIRGVTLVGAVCNLGLAGAKTAAGTLSGSQALLADGVHSLSDLATDVAVWAGARYWTAPADSSHPYGHGRIETLVNIFIAGVLAIAALGLGWRAVMSLGSPPPHPPGWGAFGVALLSILVKETLYQWTVRQGRRIRSSALLANAWHHRSDALSSVPVAVAVVTSHLVPGLAGVDAVAALIVAVMLLKATWVIGWPCVQELVESARCSDVETATQRVAAEFAEITEVHKIRSRRLGSMFAIDLHLLIAPDTTVKDAHDTAEAFKARLIEAEPGIADILVHIEPARRGARQGL
jgi:cation diffusion facilitator family transporter